MNTKRKLGEAPPGVIPIAAPEKAGIYWIKLHPKIDGEWLYGGWTLVFYDPFRQDRRIAPLPNIFLRILGT